MKKDTSRGFTLLELLVVIGIIALLSIIVAASMSESRERGRDAGRKAQTQELLKALELYYSNNGMYPTHNDGDANTHGSLEFIDSDFYGAGRSLSRLPDEAYTGHYYYCVSANGSSMVLAVNTENDRGSTGSDFCHITRGASPFGCTFSGAGANVDADDSCALRF